MKLFSIVLISSSFLFADFQDELDNDPREANKKYIDKYNREFNANHSKIKKLLDRNLKCLEGTEKIASNLKCYSVYLSITELKEKKHVDQALIDQLETHCPDWKDYQVEECEK